MLKRLLKVLVLIIIGLPYFTIQGISIIIFVPLGDAVKWIITGSTFKHGDLREMISAWMFNMFDEKQEKINYNSVPKMTKALEELVKKRPE